MRRLPSGSASRNRMMSAPRSQLPVSPHGAADRSNHRRHRRRRKPSRKLGPVSFRRWDFTGPGLVSAGPFGVADISSAGSQEIFCVQRRPEGFVWLGLDGVFSPTVTHDMGAAFMLYAQGLLPFLLPLSVLLFEPDRKSRKRMQPFLALGAGTTLYILWALIAYPLEVYVRGNSIVYINQATNNTIVALLYVIVTCGSLFFSQLRMMVVFGATNLAS